MFESLSGRLQTLFRNLKGQGVLTEANVAEAAREIRRALLEADVHYQVAKDFVAEVATKASGQEVLSSVTPGQQFVKVVHDALVALLSWEGRPLACPRELAVWVMAGLQGTGKTTTCAKLGRFLVSQGRRPLLVAADLKRPAAVEQLTTLAASAGLEVHARPGVDAVGVCREALDEARRRSLDAILVDTAGRLHVDEEMMRELSELLGLLSPHETFWVLDAMAGQDAVNAVLAFAKRVNLTGVVLTKLDGDARGGVAISVRKVTGLPIRFAGTGERLDRLEPFHADRIASRILGMGDVVGLVEKVQEAVDHEKTQRIEERLRRAEFNLEDLLEQVEQVRKMGSLKDLLGMLPGLGQAQELPELSDREILRTRAILQSMTLEERRNPDLIDGSRRRRIASGSGTSVQAVNALLKQFHDMKRLVKQVRGGKLPRGMRLRGLPG